jgi:hypothetical protein
MIGKPYVAQNRHEDRGDIALYGKKVNREKAKSIENWATGILRSLSTSFVASPSAWRVSSATGRGLTDGATDQTQWNTHLDRTL